MAEKEQKKYKWEITDPSLFKMWLEEKFQLADSSINVYVAALKSYLQNDPNIEDLSSYNTFLIKTAVKKRATFYFTVLKHYINFKIPDSTLRNKLIDGMIRPKVKANLWDRKYLEQDKLLELINVIKKQKHRVLALIQMMTGVRVGDILNLRYKDVVPEVYEGKEVLRLNIIGKRMKRNVVYIHDKIVQDVIMEYVGITREKPYEDYLFIDNSNRHYRQKSDNEFVLKKLMNYRWFMKDLKYALSLIGVDKMDFATHDFRRCFARRAWNKWKDVQILQRLLNHTNASVTMKYLEQSGLQNIDYHAEMQKFS